VHPYGKLATDAKLWSFHSRPLSQAQLDDVLVLRNPGSNTDCAQAAAVWRCPDLTKRLFPEGRSEADGPPGQVWAVRLHIVYTLVMSSEGTTTVRVRRPDSERLQSLAKSRRTTVIDVLHSAIDALERQEFLRGLNDDYRRLRDDPEKWQQYLAERQEWDSLA
jgi:hypothetical protein